MKYIFFSAERCVAVCDSALFTMDSAIATAFKMCTDDVLEMYSRERNGTRIKFEGKIKRKVVEEGS